MLNYLTHIAFKLYENITVPIEAPNRFQIEVLFRYNSRNFLLRLSSGTSDNPFGINDEHIQQIAPMISIHDHLSFKRFEQILQRVDEVAIEHAPPAKKEHQSDEEHEHHHHHGD